LNSKTAAFLLGKRLVKTWSARSPEIIQAKRIGAIVEASGRDNWQLFHTRTRKSVLPLDLAFADRDHAFACWLGTRNKPEYTLVHRVDPMRLAVELCDNETELHRVVGDIQEDEADEGQGFLVLIKGGLHDEERPPERD
jgi:hypothetical protein